MKRNCDECGKSYTYQRSISRFCSQPCQKKAMMKKPPRDISHRVIPGTDWEAIRRLPGVDIDRIHRVHK